MNNSVVIVIPIHLEFPSEYELISFQQCYKILYNYSIKIIAPQGLNLKEYRKYIPNLDVLYIPPKWQSSIEMYNKLKLSKYFSNDVFDKLYLDFSIYPKNEKKKK